MSASLPRVSLRDTLPDAGSSMEAENLSEEKLIRRARAKVATQTDSAPACNKARAAARAVAPVVRMSSIKRTCLPKTAAGSDTPNAPRTFKRRCRGVSPAWLSVSRKRISVLGASARRHAVWCLRKQAIASVARSRAWLNPRSACLDRWSGTGTTSISAGASGASCAIAWASSSPSLGATGRRRSYLSA